MRFAKFSIQSSNSFSNFFIVRLNANRKVTGILRGYDQFMNLVLDNAIEEVSANDRFEIGMVVCIFSFFSSHY